VTNPDSLTRDSFLQALFEQLEQLRAAQVDVPDDLDVAVERVLESSPETFELDVFRYGAAHLLHGLDPEMAEQQGGVEMLTERAWALAANLQNCLKIASERRGLAV
jgi:hypothetical protein